MQQSRNDEVKALYFTFVFYEINHGKMKKSEQRKLTADISAEFLEFAMQKRKFHSVCPTCDRPFNYKIPKKITCDDCRWNATGDVRCRTCVTKDGFRQNWEHKCPICNRKKPNPRERKFKVGDKERIKSQKPPL